MSLLQTQALSHLVIQASDITRSMEFYQRVFGYRVTHGLARAEPANRVIGVGGKLVLLNPQSARSRTRRAGADPRRPARLRACGLLGAGH